ncbi:MAG: hypothetical protein AB8B65_01290 [Kordia sp.]|uniref:hypothetical protein n=1 Tax=Kordia sp. TaxID=1965332 RepID=UPI00385D95DD
MSERIPKKSIYRRLPSELDVDYLYKPIAYNLKKYLKFITKTAKSGVKSLGLLILKIKPLSSRYILIVSGVNLVTQ